MTGWLKAGRLPNALQGRLGQTRGDLKKRFEDAGLDMKGDGKVTVLGKSYRDAANELSIEWTITACSLPAATNLSTG